MSLHHDYRYDLRVEGAEEKELEAFSNAFAETCFIDYMGRDSTDPTLFSTEVLEGSGGEYEETIEEELHQLAMKFPKLTLYFYAEDLDDHGHGFELKFHGNQYQRSDLMTRSTGFCPPVPFEQRHDAMQIHAARDLKVHELLDELCTNTDFDLLHAQKQALLDGSLDNKPIPKEALDGLISFLDRMGTLGEALGRFQYDGIEPPFPMLPDYQKRQVSFEPAPAPALHLLCEEHEDADNIREFTVLAASHSEEDLRKLMQAKIQKDDYGLIAKNGVKEGDAWSNYFSTNYEDFSGFVEYYIFQQDVLTPDKVQELLASPEYADVWNYPDNLPVILEGAIRNVLEQMDCTDVDVPKLVNQTLADKKFQAMAKDAIWTFGENASHITAEFAVKDAAQCSRNFLVEALHQDPNFFEKSGARPAYDCPDNLKQILINSIYDVCRDRHLPVNDPEAKADAYMQMSSFRDAIKFPGIQHLEDGSESYQDAVWACYDFAEDQLLPEHTKKGPALDTMIQAAKEKTQQSSNARLKDQSLEK